MEALGPWKHQRVSAGFGLSTFDGGRNIVVVRRGKPHIRQYKRNVPNGMSFSAAVSLMWEVLGAKTETEMRRIVNDRLFTIGGIDRSSNRFWISGA